MNNFKNLLIAILTGLLALSLFSQPAQSAPKTYDALKLAEYEACLAANNNTDLVLLQVNGGNGDVSPLASVKNCVRFRP